jgi:hypothetical protein
MRKVTKAYSVGWENTKGRNHLEDPDTDDRILILILKKKGESMKARAAYSG